MGLNVCVMIADSPLDDDALAAWDLVPLGEHVRAEEVVLTPADQRACVVVRDGATIVVDGGGALADAMEGALDHLPGRIHLASIVSSVDHLDWQVLEAGRTTRRVHVDDEGELVSTGDPLRHEKDVLGITDPESEFDGDLLFERLPALAGLPGSVELFELTGQAYGPAEMTHTEAAQPEAPTGQNHQRGFFRRLFGR